MPKIIFKQGEDGRILIAAMSIVLMLSLPFAYWEQALAVTGAVNLTATVTTSLTFTTTTGTGDVFGSITAGTSKYATTTLAATTNDVLGWLVSLSGDNKTSSNNNLELAGNAASIPDQTEWVPGAATTSAGNAVRISSLANSTNVLAFRVMTASSTNGATFISSTWWGSADNYADAATTLWAGISSSTVQRTIGNAGSGSYSSTAHLNTVLYYVNVAATQQSGAYSAPLTFTATGN